MFLVFSLWFGTGNFNFFLRHCLKFVERIFVEITLRFKVLFTLWLYSTVGINSHAVTTISMQSCLHNERKVSTVFTAMKSNQYSVKVHGTH